MTRRYCLSILFAALALNASLAAGQQAGVQSDWSQVVGAEAQIGAGFGNPMNVWIRPIVLHQGAIFAATFNNDTGTEVWTSDTGLNWTQVHNGGIGSTDFVLYSLVSFQGYLYAAPRSTTPCLWRSPGGSDWNPVNGPCSAQTSTNEAVRSMLSFGGFLYASTENSVGGGEIWRSIDGESWEPVVVGGFDNPENEVLFSLEEFRGDLYVGGGPYGCGVWRSSDGLNWTQVVHSCFPGSYSCLDTLESFKGSIYAGVSPAGLPGFNLWSSTDGVHWTEGAYEPWLLLTGTERELYSTSSLATLQVLVSDDGMTFVPDNEERFGNPNNGFYTVLVAINGYLYAGTQNTPEGSELWRKPLIMFADGFESGDTSAWSATVP